uniref:F-box domain-containing protein n=1 Tax=Aegilops tauschii TaxID=37682 RepID=M8BB35_AEGTA
MGNELLAADAPPAKRPAISSTTTTTTPTTAADGTATTISSLGQDQLLDIFLTPPTPPARARAALPCRPWLGAVRSSRSFRRLFRALHPAPLIGLFIDIDGAEP